MSSPPPWSQALRPCWFPPARLPPAPRTHPSDWGMLGEKLSALLFPPLPPSTPAPTSAPSSGWGLPSSLLEPWAPLANPQGPSQASASPGYLQAGPVSTALPSLPLGVSAAQLRAAGWGGLRRQRTRRQAWGWEGEAAALSSQRCRDGLRAPGQVELRSSRLLPIYIEERKRGIISVVLKSLERLCLTSSQQKELSQDQEHI